jgi:hypothetical protein
MDWRSRSRNAPTTNFTTIEIPSSGAAEVALKLLSTGWCQASDGCMASTWTPRSLPLRLASELLRSGSAAGMRERSSATACFDLALSSEPGVRSVALCPDGKSPDHKRRRYQTGAPNITLGIARAARRRQKPRGRVVSPVFEGEFGFELLHALPFLHWLDACGLLAAPSVCRGMSPFYFFSGAGTSEHRCGTRPARSRWRAGSLPQGMQDGWNWAGRHSLRYYAYPSRRWLPPPLHAHYRPLPLPARHATAGAAGSIGTGRRWHGRVWLQNKYYPEGHGTADNFWSLDELCLILDRLLSCGFQVVYNHPELALLGTSDVNDQGKQQRSFQLGDIALIQTRYQAALVSGALLLLPQLARRDWSSLSFNEVQLRVVSKCRCFLAPQGGASYLTFYQPGLHIVNDKTGKERCASAQLASGGRSGAYWHYFTTLPSAAGESIIFNVAGNRSRLVAALDVMCSSEACHETAQALDAI